MCWREEREAALPEVPFVVAAAPLTVLRVLSRNGSDDVRTLAVMVGRPGEGKGRAEIVGVAEAEVYWLERGRSESSETTVLRRVALPEGKPETLISEAGRRAAALTPDALVWTAPSLEEPPRTPARQGWKGQSTWVPGRSFFGRSMFARGERDSRSFHQ